MTDSHKLRMKIGAFEFEAEGDKELVEAQLKQFLALVAQAPAAAAAHDHSKAVSAAGPDRPPADASADAADPDRPAAALLARRYKLDREIVSLRFLPKTKSYAADALLLLIYGNALLKREREVLGGILLKGGRQSGLSLDRVDRILNIHGQFVEKGGTRKGARYGLNNRGIEKARQLLESAFD